MNNDNKWLLMTYYCPTHGSNDRCEQVQLTREDLAKEKLKFNKKTKL